jgi:CheY-like chemotaxis protein
MEGRLTMHPATSEEPSSPSRSRSPARVCEQVTILVLDGEDNFCNGLVANLRDDGHPVLECHSPAALPPPESLNVDALFIDIQGPGDRWMAFARRLHRRFPSVRIVLATAEWAPPFERVARTIGSLVYKPVNYEALHELLHAGNGSRC